MGGELFVVHAGHDRAQEYGLVLAAVIGQVPVRLAEGGNDLGHLQAELAILVGEGRAVTLLGHCTERATSPAQLDAWCTVLSAAGYTVETPAVGCCGMAGIFGHEPANQEMSHRLWELSWQAPASAAGLVAATGYSCRSQGRRHETRLLHPVELLIGG